MFAKMATVTPPRAAAAVLLVLALVAGCGGGGSDSDGAVEPGPGATTAPDVSKPGNGGTASDPKASAGPSAAASPGSPDAKPTAGSSPAELRKATQFADAGVLLAADLPGFTGETQAIDTSDDRAEEALYTCLRAPRPTYVARNPGSVWTKGAQRIASAADVLTSPKAAKQDLIASKSGLAPTCFREYLLGQLAGDGMSVSAQSDGLPVTVKGSDGAFAVKVTISVSDANTSTKLIGYLVGTVVGSVQISVLSLQTDGSTPTLAEAARLAGLAVARVKATSQG